ncbi:hypothetical protein [Kaarinaea lacus]
MSANSLSFDFGGKAGFENFQWEEFDRNGSKLLKESGNRFVIAAFLGNTYQQTQGFIYRVDLKSYFGEVDYEGGTWDGVAAQSETDYTGFGLEGEAGYRLGTLTGSFGWDISARVGFDIWSRDINDTFDVSGRYVKGYTEVYTIQNLRLGTGPSWNVGRWNARFIAGGKYPFATNEFIGEDELGYDDDLNLEPKGKWSPFFNFYNYFQLSDKVLLVVDVYYDTYQFDPSDPVSPKVNGIPVTPVYQPESKQVNYGLQGGISMAF